MGVEVIAAELTATASEKQGIQPAAYVHKQTALDYKLYLDYKRADV